VELNGRGAMGELDDTRILRRLGHQIRLQHRLEDLLERSVDLVSRVA
jgi:hypothetical protein